MCMKNMSNVCQLYRQGNSARKIGKILGRSYQSVLNELHKNNVQIRYYQKGMIEEKFINQKT